MSYVVAALYQFTAFAEPDRLRAPLLDLCRAQQVKGTLLLAREGINGTIAGHRHGIDRVLSHIRGLPGCERIEVKESTAQDMPFLRLKVRLKAEIVTLGQPNVDPRTSVGTYVKPEVWNQVIARDDVVVIDTRNDYEVALGSFDNAVNPRTDSFRGFPEWWRQNADKYRGKTVAMFCTGGIRCEKASNWLLGQGVEDVLHLEGGILRYLETVPQDQSRWNGECFVFDNRVSVGHGLAEGPHVLCHACRRPILPEDRLRPEFEQGVTCHQCFAERDADARMRYRERQRQVDLARTRGEAHLGDAAVGKRNAK
ncbi:MAG: rhodanese-related sulfurtransferase [Pseudomonadota bacterium]